MTITNQIIIDALQIAQEKQRIYEAIKRKRGIDFPYNPLSGYSDAIDKITTRGIPTMIANMPFEVGDEPTTGNVWYVKTGVSGNRTGTSWDSAFATRQEAVNAASAGDRVYVWEGTYYLEAVQTLKAGVSEFYGFNDDGSWAKRQPFTHPSKHDAGFTANNFDNTAYIFLDEQIIDGLWMQNVVTAGGIYCTQNTYLRNCVVTNCTSSSNGGGMYLNASSTATNCVVTNCTATNQGGGMYVNNPSTATNCVVTNCSAGTAGGMYLNASSTATNCVVTNCTSSSNGGGMWLYNSSIATNCVVTNCTATNQGGGMYLYNFSTATNCVVTNCTSSNNGGGMFMNYSAATNCTVILCSAATGSGFYGSNSQILYNCCSWGCNIYLAKANYAYKIYNCASNFALTGVTNWDTVADVQNFLPLSTFPFAAAGVAPFDGSGAYYTNLAKGEESTAFIDRVIIPSLTNPCLYSTSPLIGAGYYEAGVTPDTDADGKTRPIPPSIGAYEP